MTQSDPPRPGHLHPPFEAYVGEQPYIFISYGHCDSALVYPELVHLRDLGYRVWYDEGIDPGNEWPEEIAKALDACALFLVMITPQSVTSANVRNEIGFALKRRKSFLAIHLQETELPRGLELQISNIQAILRYRMPAGMYDRKLEKVLPGTLIEASQKAAPAAAPSPPAPAPTIRLSIPTPPPPATPAGHKMFLTLAETAARLDRSEAEVLEMGYKNVLRVFCDGPNKMFRTNDVETLNRELDAGREPLFDDALAHAAPGAVDEISLAPFDDDSGLLDLTRETDDDSGISLIGDFGTLADGGLLDLKLDDVFSLDAAPAPAASPGSAAPQAMPGFSFPLPPAVTAKPTAKPCWGIDVGASALRAIRLRAAGGEAQADKAFLYPFKPPLDDKAADCDARITRALKAWADTCQPAGAAIYASVPSDAVKAWRRAAEPAHVRGILADAAKAEPDRVLDHQFFGAGGADEIKLRQHLGNLEAAGGFMLLHSLPRTVLGQWLGYFETVGLKLDGLASAAAAIGNAVAHEKRLTSQSGGLAVLDVGSHYTEVFVVDGGQVACHRLPIGGMHFTQRLTKEFKLTFASAERLKIDAVNSPDPKRVFQAMRPAFVDFVEEVRAVLAPYQRPGRAPLRVLGLGAGARLTGLHKYMAMQLNLEAQPLERFDRIPMPAPVAKALDGRFGEVVGACGLALQGMGLGILNLNFAKRPGSLLGNLLGGLWNG